MKQSIVGTIALAGMLALAAPAAWAADPAPAPAAPAFAPIVLDQSDVKTLTDYVGTLPFNQAEPIMRFLSQKEAEAQKRAGEKK